MNSLLSAIPFPNLDPTLVRLGPLAVRWYGLAYLASFGFAYFALKLLVRRNSLRIGRDALADVVTWAAVGVVLGGRLGWWLFYHRGNGVPSAWYEPLAIWHGGMSFHGGVLGVAIALLAWCKRSKVSYWNVTDAVSLVAPVGLFLGRIANFINAELVGRQTLLPWGIVFPGDTVARHPSQLYEAVLEGPLLLLVLVLVRSWSRKRDGRTTATFLTGYGLVRFGIEFTREPDAQLGFIAFGWLTMGQILSAVIAAVGVVLLALRSHCFMQELNVERPRPASVSAMPH